MPPIITDEDPFTIVSGGPTQTSMSPTRAAGNPPINTLGWPGPVIGPPTCGMGGSPGVCIGHAWKSVSRAAGGIFVYWFTGLLVYWYLYFLLYGFLNNSLVIPNPAATAHGANKRGEESALKRF
jgi:hypothetical protein